MRLLSGARATQELDRKRAEQRAAEDEYRKYTAEADDLSKGACCVPRRVASWRWYRAEVEGGR